VDTQANLACSELSHLLYGRIERKLQKVTPRSDGDVSGGECGGLRGERQWCVPLRRNNGPHVPLAYKEEPHMGRMGVADIRQIHLATTLIEHGGTQPKGSHERDDRSHWHTRPWLPHARGVLGRHVCE
jgi:hypothetical protein